MKRIELHNVRTCREVRVPSAGADVSLYRQVGRRVVPGVFSIPANEVFGVLGDPRVIRRSARVTLDCGCLVILLVDMLSQVGAFFVLNGHAPEIAVGWR